MAIQTVKATINGQEYDLTYSSGTGKWTATITAPNKSSYNQPNHYYDVTLKATDDAGNAVTKDSTDSTLGDSLKLYVKEKGCTYTVYHLSNSKCFDHKQQARNQMAGS